MFSDTKNNIDMKTKRCYYCNEEKPLDEYHKDKNRKDGLQNKCKLCNKQYHQENKERISEQKKQHRQENKESIAEYQKQYHQENRERILERQKQYRQENKERILERKKQYRQENKERIVQYRQENKERIAEQQKQYLRKRRKTDPLFRLRHNISRLIRGSLSNNGYTKKSKTYEILGCSYDEFVKHIESQFVEGMSWKNQGEWELDHIIPVSSHTNKDELIKLNHYTNFQPLWGEDNRRKSDSYLEEDKQRFLEQFSLTLKIKQ